MIGNVVSRRYAKALLEINKEPKDVDRIDKELKNIASLIEENKGLRDLLYNPGIDLGFKKGILAEIIEIIKVMPVVSRFLYLLLEKNRLNHIMAISLIYGELSNEIHNRVKALITSGYQIPEDSKKRLKEKLSKLTKKEVLLEEKIDPYLVGGIKIQMGGYIIDGSIKNQLGHIKEELLKGVKG